MILSVSGVRFSYSSRPVLRDIEFSLKPGHVLGVLGVNGAGKSTLIKCLNRIHKPQAGWVLVEGENLMAMQGIEIAKRIGYVPQRHPETRLTVFEAVLLGRKPHMGWSMEAKDHALTEKIIRRMGIDHLAMRPVSELSGGEVQKVVIARALAQAPKVLLLDEPTSNLDLKNQLEVMGLIRTIVDTESLSAVVAIHDLNMALRFADLFLLLKNHTVMAMAGKDDLTSAMFEEVYGVRVTLQEFGGHTMVVPL